MRKYYLDNVRWVTVVIVVIYHVFYMYNAEGILGGLGKITGLSVQYYDIFQYFVYPWFMPVLYLAAGMSISGVSVGALAAEASDASAEQETVIEQAAAEEPEAVPEAEDEQEEIAEAETEEPAEPEAEEVSEEPETVEEVSAEPDAEAEITEETEEDAEAEAAEQAADAEEEIVSATVEGEVDTVEDTSKNAAPENGWYTDEYGDKFYYIDGEKVCDTIIEIDGDLYGFDESFNTTPSQHPIPASESCLEIRHPHLVDSSRDGVLTRGEEARMVFEIFNTSSKPVYRVLPMVRELTGNKHIRVSENVLVESIMPGKGIRYTAVIRTDNKLHDGEAVFRISVFQGSREMASQAREFRIMTSKR